MKPRRPTSADVAALAGVSRTTVSFVLNERTDVAISQSTRRRVRDAARRLGYHPHSPARQLAGGRSQTLGLVLRQTPEHVAGDALLAETLRGLAGAARAADYRVIVEPLAPGNGSYDEMLRSRQTDGLIVSGPRVDDPALPRLVEDGFPIVLQGSLPGLGSPSVDVDNFAGARLATEHLIELGHRTIGCITNAPLAYTAARERLDGYHAAIRSAGLPADDDLVAEAEFDASSGRRAMAGLLESVPVTAVFVASDVVALGAYAAIHDAGLGCPDDVSVVGFDDIPLAAFFDPPLTTVRVPAHDLGLAAGSALLDRIEGRPVPTRTLLPTELVVRSSTAPPRSATDAERGGGRRSQGSMEETDRAQREPEKGVIG
jgi:LacI family transcriptional regulator